MHQNRTQSKTAKLLCELPSGIRTPRRSLLAAALGIAVTACLLPETAHAQEYPWCVSRESYLDCAYTAHQQCQWTASGIGGWRPESTVTFSQRAAPSDAKSASWLKARLRPAN